jgi:hypothetical protein
VPARPPSRAAFGALACALSCAVAAAAHAQSAEELAKKLANPVAALISVPLQFNYDGKIGPERDGDRFQLNIQPVVPIGINADWNLISRTILPIVSQDDVYPGSGSVTGIGDTVQSFFLSPKAPGEHGWIWGVGPVFLLPTGSDSQLSARKWGAGPTGVALKQDGPWTYGVLANHIASFAGSSSRPYVNATFLQPFLTYTTPDAWSYTLQTESTYDWRTEQWSVPVNVLVSKVTKLGDQLVSLGGGLRYWADSPESGPHGWGVRLLFTLLFPK